MTGATTRQKAKEGTTGAGSSYPGHHASTSRPERQAVDEDEVASVGERDTVKRTLYECSHARVGGSRIYCERGYVLSAKSNNGGLEVKRLARGDPLALDVCQDCLDFDSIGPPIPEEERGWVRKKTTRVTRTTSRGQKKDVVDIEQMA
jgi:hypothetical protein